MKNISKSNLGNCYNRLMDVSDRVETDGWPDSEMMPRVKSEPATTTITTSTTS